MKHRTKESETKRERWSKKEKPRKKREMSIMIEDRIIGRNIVETNSGRYKDDGRCRLEKLTKSTDRTGNREQQSSQSEAIEIEER